VGGVLNTAAECIAVAVYVIFSDSAVEAEITMTSALVLVIFPRNSVLDTLVQNLQTGPTGEQMGKVADDRLESSAAKAIAAKVVKTKTCARKDMTLVPARSLLMEKERQICSNEGNQSWSRARARYERV